MEIGHTFHNKYTFNNKNTFQVEVWPISCLNDSETQERGLKGEKSKQFPGEARPTPLEDCAFGASLGNRSVFILVPRLKLNTSMTCFMIRGAHIVEIKP